MKALATNSESVIAALKRWVLEKERIPFETHFAREERLPTHLAREERRVIFFDLLVADEDYDRASAAIKKWQSEGHCPQCNSLTWEEAKDSPLAGHYAHPVWECQSCGFLLLGHLPQGRRQ